MSSGVQIIQSIEYHGKVFEPVNIELGVLDVRMVCLELHIWIELMCRPLSHLGPYVSIECGLLCLFDPPKPSIS
jgi:hypothetical protein